MLTLKSDMLAKKKLDAQVQYNVEFASWVWLYYSVFHLLYLAYYADKG